jgi:hypothetical protein
MITRLAFIRRMAFAALACGLIEVRLPELERDLVTAPVRVENLDDLWLPYELNYVRAGMAPPSLERHMRPR